MSALVVRGGRVVDPANKVDRRADLFVVDGRVAALGEKPPRFPAGARSIDARGAVVAPGFVDLHVHLREPGQEGKETLATGARAALAGGFTTVCCMANTTPVNDSALVTDWIVERARRTAAPCKVRPVGAVTKGLLGVELAELFGMADAGVVAFSDDGMPVMSAGLYRRAMELAAQTRRPVISHCEDLTLSAGGAMHEGDVSTALGLPGVPWTSEAVMVARDVLLAEQTGARLHVAHLSTGAGVRIVREAKARGIAVTAEVTPHHLSLDQEANGLSQYDTRFKMSPPLRERRDRQALVEALADGTIDAIATDHAPHGEGDKHCEFGRAANGVTGLESALPVVLGLVRDGSINLIRAVELLTSGPARVLSLEPAGSLAVGAPADVTIFEPATEWLYRTPVSRSHNSPWLGATLTGWVRQVIVDGVPVAAAGEKTPTRTSPAATRTGKSPASSRRPSRSDRDGKGRRASR